jgi:hypothetical protein
MFADLEALAPSVIVCAAFLVGVIWLLRREMAPRRASRKDRGGVGNPPAGPEPDPETGRPDQDGTRGQDAASDQQASSEL